jgi:EmrB/QacA subfamily drug resistance transporter
VTDTLTEAAAPELSSAPAVATATPTAPAAAPAVTAAPAGRFDYRWLALFVVLGGSVMTILDATVVNVAIPTLQNAFNVGSYSEIAWVITGYSLAQGAVIPITGWATDRFGTKRLYLVSLFLFTAASIACGLAWNLPVLILFRVFQGLGGGMLMPIGLTVIMRAFGPSQMGRVMGYFGIPLLIAPALGPVLGGWFSQDFSWRLIFFINIPVGVVSFGAAWRLLRETPTSRAFRLDWIGLFTATPAVVALMYAMSVSITAGWGSPEVIGLLVVAAVLMAVFIWRQLTAEQPLLHLSLFSDATFSWSIVLSFVLVTALFGAVFLLPVFLQSVHGYGPLDTGLFLLPQALVAAALMPVGGRLSDRIGPRPVVMAGLIVLAISSVVLARLDAQTGVAFIVVAMMLRGGAMAFAMMPGMSAGLARIPRHLTSRASSITNTTQRVAQSLGIALLVTFLSAQSGTAASQATCAPSAHVVTVSGAGSAEALCASLEQRAAHASQNSGEGTAASRVINTGDAEYDAFLTAYSNQVTSTAFDRTFALLAIVAVLGLIPAWFLRKPDPQAAEPAAAAG